MWTGTHRSRRVAAFALLLAACGGDGGGDGRTGQAEKHASVVHLATGDSVEYVGVGPALIPNQPSGLLVTYHPFFSPDADTLRVIRIADELWRESVKPSLREPLPPFVVLRATSRRAGPIRGAFAETAYGMVLERRADGKWYRLGTSQAVE